MFAILQSNSSLYQKTLENGSVFLSQYPPGTQPHPAQFLQRNALISAWSTELVVVEANEKSGALWTADFASKQGKPSIPFHIPFIFQKEKEAIFYLQKKPFPT